MKKLPSNISTLANEVREKTGFILEHDVASIFENSGWTVIHNRYYLDDVQAIQREIDLLVYKVSKYEDTSIFTTIIISCKKSTFKDWVFLTRDAQGTKVNLNTEPFTYWSNHDIVNYQLEGRKISEINLLDQKRAPRFKKLFKYDKVVYGFREYDNKKVNKLENDTGIYDSIISLIKSQSFELESLPTRRKNGNYYYNINLLTIADVNRFIEIECKEDKTTEKPVDKIIYVNRFLVNRQENNARVVFTRFENLKGVVSDFNFLHEANNEIVLTGISNFYEKLIYKDYSARQLLVKKYSTRLLNSVKWRLHTEYLIENEPILYIGYSKENGFELEIALLENIIEYMNNDDRITDITANWLTRYFRYSGKFRYVILDLPF